MDEHTAEVDPAATHRSHRKCPPAASQRAKHDGLIGHLLLVIDHDEAQDRRHRLGRDAMHLRVVPRVEAVALDCLGGDSHLKACWRGQLRRHGAHTADGVQLHRDDRAAHVARLRLHREGVLADRRACWHKLLVECVLGPELLASRQEVERVDRQRGVVQLLPSRRPRRRRGAGGAERGPRPILAQIKRGRERRRRRHLRWRCAGESRSRGLGQRRRWGFGAAHLLWFEYVAEAAVELEEGTVQLHGEVVGLHIHCHHLAARTPVRQGVEVVGHDACPLWVNSRDLAGVVHLPARVTLQALGMGGQRREGEEVRVRVSLVHGSHLVLELQQLEASVLAEGGHLVSRALPAASDEALVLDGAEEGELGEGGVDLVHLVLLLLLLLLAALPLRLGLRGRPRQRPPLDATRHPSRGLVKRVETLKLKLLRRV
mmetsp:Transcript_67252/g.162519  ORF Transcript_67252/g.162519 Transcript_67252/m.162519 type:complete len:429 (-) Transcript_67252:1981-3267(-)